MTNEPKNRPTYSSEFGSNNNNVNYQNVQGDYNTIGDRQTSNEPELKVEIQQILNELAKNHITKKEAVATEAIKEEIKDKPALKQRLINAFKAGGTEALKQIFEHPAVSISIETIKGFLEGESR